MKKLLVLALALILALGCVSALAEEELPESLDIQVLVWKYDDTYGSTVRAAMEKWAEYYSEEMGIDIQLTMYDAADDIGKQIEQATMICSPVSYTHLDVYKRQIPNRPQTKTKLRSFPKWSRCRR